MYNEAKVGSKSLQAQASSSFELEESSPSSESNNGGERLKDGNNYRLRAAGLVMREGKDVNDPVHVMYNEAKVGSKSLQAQASSSFELEESSPSSESNNGGERLKDGNNYRLRAAGLVMREGKDVNDPEVLLVSGMKIATNYIIPGGGLEPGESSKEAALRETMEEAGIVGEIILTVGEFRVILD
uniref:Nudix hydrolase domain-containing protein n=1 Tax=Rhabditophanes sp. KR3021 TaxID=114890 RepID=A0AC35TND4_9BILA